MKFPPPTSPVNTPMSLSPAPDYAMMESMGDYGGQVSHSKLRRLAIFLLMWWWVPVLTLVIGFGSGAGLALWSPPTFVSIARMLSLIHI